MKEKKILLKVLKFVRTNCSTSIQECVEDIVEDCLLATIQDLENSIEEEDE